MIQSGTSLNSVVMNLNHSVCLGSVVSLQLWKETHVEEECDSYLSESLCQQRYIDEAMRTYTWTPVEGADYR